MTDYEVMLIEEAYKDIKETERIAIERARENDGNTSVVDVIKLPNSRFNLPDDNKKETEN